MDRLKQMALMAIAGGALLALGSVLPWIALVTGLGSINVAGTEGDGVLTLAFGGAAVLFAVFGLGGNRGALATVAAIGILAILFVGWEIANVSGKVADLQSDVARASVGSGLWVAGFGAVLAAAGGIGGWRVPE